MSKDTRIRAGLPATSGLLVAALMLSPAMAQTESEATGQASDTEQSVDAKFDQLDQNGDGYLTAEEVLSEAEVAAVQEELDADADGRISRTEFAAMETGTGAAGQADYDWGGGQQQSGQQTAGQGAGALSELASQEEQLSKFVEAVERTGMADALTEGGQQYTIFAPTNEAFEDYGRNLEDLTQDELVNVLRAHIVADDVDPQMARRISKAKTIGGGSVQIDVEEDDTLKVGDAEVTEPDIQQGNLRVYAINSVLEPGAQLAAATEGQTDSGGQTSGRQSGAAIGGVTFEELDEDGDGYLSEQELEAAVDLDVAADELDADADGQVSRTEFAAFEQEAAGMEPTDDFGASDDQSGSDMPPHHEGQQEWNPDEE